MGSVQHRPLNPFLLFFVLSGCLEEKPKVAPGPVFACDFPGVVECESALYISVGPEESAKPSVIFQVYDLNQPPGDGLTIELIDVHWTNGPSHPSEFDGREIRLYDVFGPEGMGPHSYYAEDFSAEDIRLWRARDGSLSPVFDPETRTFNIEWDLTLHSYKDPLDPLERQEKGSAKAPVLVECWVRVQEGGDSRHDFNFETEFCKPWKAFSTDHL